MHVIACSRNAMAALAADQNGVLVCSSMRNVAAEWSEPTVQNGLQRSCCITAAHSRALICAGSFQGLQVIVHKRPHQLPHLGWLEGGRIVPSLAVGGQGSRGGGSVVHAGCARGCAGLNNAPPAAAARCSEHTQAHSRCMGSTGRHSLQKGRVCGTRARLHTGTASPQGPRPHGGCCCWAPSSSPQTQTSAAGRRGSGACTQVSSCRACRSACTHAMLGAGRGKGATARSTPLRQARRAPALDPSASFSSMGSCQH